MKKEWKVGDKYHIVHNGNKLTGTIIDIEPDGCFVVEWSDGEKTVEDTISPMSKK